MFFLSFFLFPFENWQADIRVGRYRGYKEAMWSCSTFKQELEVCPARLGNFSFFF